ncbi:MULTISPECIES: hypothetical protein [Rhodobacterales]|uniref:hypothetical protein n=1 Tax=Rhodobacterales TaxID=204455 RepID=UPI00237EEBEB|nr:hypothetical protein [Phaeobacter gallaeciensis]MDE4142123.1 hypothetical protein [Phaeobacter gallaeciensis]MDE4150568.1 hypothetical protein [Phaeobacter gallaeciensis]MDE4154589.1 hypothetical protein [Phaeobacter gallaeciensis]MDE4229980.1 hypothetical protein [Phaeobacter gallaeciensis]MDE4259261.1 hypothetical protein [Phaeobacter gallaeciensis]
MPSPLKSKERFSDRKEKGDKTEKAFMDLIALMGGTAQAIGKVPTMGDPTPRFCRPSAQSEDGFRYSVSPDIVFTLPDQPRGMASLAQVKLKKLQRDPSKGRLLIYLDEQELHRMNEAAMFYDVFFVIHVPELAATEGFSEWMWVNVDDLQEDRISLIKRRIQNKPTFLLPLDLFRPLSELKKRPLHAPSNTNAPPTDRRV